MNNREVTVSSKTSPVTTADKIFYAKWMASLVLMALTMYFSSPSVSQAGYRTTGTFMLAIGVICSLGAFHCIRKMSRSR